MSLCFPPHLFLDKKSGCHHNVIVSQHDRIFFSMQRNLPTDGMAGEAAPGFSLTLWNQMEQHIMTTARLSVIRTEHVKDLLCITTNVTSRLQNVEMKFNTAVPMLLFT